MEKQTKNTNTNDTNFGVLFDGEEYEGEEEESIAQGAGGPSPLAPAKAPMPKRITPVQTLNPQHFRLIGEFDLKPGEDGWTYLDRITPLLLKELVAMASAPVSVINPKVKLDALKELIQRPMPARQVYDIRTPPVGNEFDRMSDEQVREFVAERLTQAPAHPAIEAKTGVVSKDTED